MTLMALQSEVSFEQKESLETFLVVYNINVNHNVCGT